MPNTHSTLSSLFSDIADEIRGKTGGSAQIKADDFPTEIAAIPSGGGGDSLFGHTAMSGTITLTSEKVASVTLATTEDVISTFASEFAGLSSLSEKYYLKDSTENTFAQYFFRELLFLHENATTHETKTNQLIMAHNIGPAVAYNQAYMAAVVDGSTVKREATETISLGNANGLRAHFTSTQKGLNGKTYKWVIFSVEHGAKVVA